MAQRIPADCRLGRSRAGLAIGYRIESLDRAIVNPFTREAVEASSILGNFYVKGGTVAPDAGGWIVWGTATKDLAEAAIEPAALGTMAARLRSLLDAQLEAFVAAVPAPVLQTDILPLQNSLEDFLTALSTTLDDTDRLQDARIASITGVVNALAEQLTGLQALNQTASRVEALDSIRIKLNELFGAQAPVVQMLEQPTAALAGVTETLDAYRDDIERLTAMVQAQAIDRAAIGRSIYALDTFLGTLEA